VFVAGGLPGQGGRLIGSPNPRAERAIRASGLACPAAGAIHHRRPLQGPGHAMGRRVAKVLAAVAILSVAGCGKSPRHGTRQAEGARMGGQDKPWWQDRYDQQKAKARERTARLLQASKSYPRPRTDPDIVLSGVGNQVALVDRKTGDYLLAQSGDQERMLLDFLYMTKEGKLVCGFKTQMSGGFAMKWEAYPIRVYAVVEADQQTDEIRAARRRISLERFAEFMTAFPTFAKNPELEFVVFEAPREPGERL
jgi:hypothetical protein